MKLSEARVEFTCMKQSLITHAKLLGFRPVENEIKREPTFCNDCGKETTHGHPKSLHRLGLAVDLILYDADFNYLTDDEYYSPLHDVWDRLGGAERILNDMNHFAYPWGGMR